MCAGSFPFPFPCCVRRRVDADVDGGDLIPFENAWFNAFRELVRLLKGIGGVWRYDAPAVADALLLPVSIAESSQL